MINFCLSDLENLVGTSSVNVQTFNASGVWEKPYPGNMVYVRLWGGGGGSCRHLNVGDYTPLQDDDYNFVPFPYFTFKLGGQSAGGGGGGYNEILIPLSTVAASVSVTVGAGGAAGGLEGGNGNFSSFGSHAIAYGGGGAWSNSFGTESYGGHGGSALYAGTVGGFNTYPFPYPWIPDQWSGGKGSDKNSRSRRRASTIFGGGGGGFGLFPNTNGLSVYGGRGGNPNEAGQIPGGGGGGSDTSDAGRNGGAGLVIVTVF